MLHSVRWIVIVDISNHVELRFRRKALAYYGSRCFIPGLNISTLLRGGAHVLFSNIEYDFYARQCHMDSRR